MPGRQMSAHVLTKRSLYKSDVVVVVVVSDPARDNFNGFSTCLESEVGGRQQARGRTIIIPSDSLYLDRQISDQILFKITTHLGFTHLLRVENCDLHIVFFSILPAQTITRHKTRETSNIHFHMAASEGK